MKVEWNQTILPNVTRSAKTGHNRIFSNSCLLNIYNLPSQAYPPAKFQLHLLITLGVTALQSSNNRKIDLYSKYRENKLQALTKTAVTYQRVEVRANVFTIVFATNQLLGKFSFTHSSSLHKKVKFMKKNQLHTIALK